jgi:hypothetical protein
MRDKPAPRGVIASLRTVVARAGSTLGTWSDEDVRWRWDNTHLAFGDARTVAMLDLASGADKER